MLFTCEKFFVLLCFLAIFVEPILTTDKYREYDVEHSEILQQATKGADLAKLRFQPEITFQNRAVLVDYLIDVSGSILGRADDEVAFAVQLFDRYGSNRVILKNMYQLLGITAFWLSLKFKYSRDLLNVEELQSLCADIYDTKSFSHMEANILADCEWNIMQITPFDVLNVIDRGVTRHEKDLRRTLTLITYFIPEFISCSQWETAIFVKEVSNLIMLESIYDHPLLYIFKTKISERLRLQKEYEFPSDSSTLFLLKRWVAT
jgi:hypothetical protein